MPVFIIIVLEFTREAVTAAQYLTRQSAEQGGFALFVTTMAERGLKFVGRFVDLSKYDVKAIITSHVQQAGVWVLGSGALILSNFASLIGQSLLALVVVFFLFEGRSGVDSTGRAVDSAAAGAGKKVIQQYIGHHCRERVQL